MAVLPFVAVTLVLDGRPVRAYAQPVLVAGHTFAPLTPYVTSVARQLSYGNRVLVLRRDEDTVLVRTSARSPDALDRAYVSIAPLLRGLGALVRYDPQTRDVLVWTPHAEPIASPTPYDARATRRIPQEVFTPEPLPTPAPSAWFGPALPRRTPIPYPT